VTTEEAGRDSSIKYCITLPGIGVCLISGVGGCSLYTQ